VRRLRRRQTVTSTELRKRQETKNKDSAGRTEELANKAKARKRARTPYYLDVDVILP